MQPKTRYTAPRPSTRQTNEKKRRMSARADSLGLLSQPCIRNQNIILARNKSEYSNPVSLSLSRPFSRYSLARIHTFTLAHTETAADSLNQFISKNKGRASDERTNRELSFFLRSRIRSARACSPFVYKPTRERTTTMTEGGWDEEVNGRLCSSRGLALEKCFN